MSPEKSAPRIRLHAKQNAAAHSRLLKELQRHNKAEAGIQKWRPLVLEANDESGQWLGGLEGETFWEWLYIDLLFVKDAGRHLGLGRALVAQAEAEARRRGCHSVYLSTFSFQAPAFYKKLGYKPMGRLENFPKGHSRQWFYKKLGDRRVTVAQKRDR